MNVTLPPDLEKYRKAQVRSGRFRTASEAVQEAVRALEERDRLETQRFEELRRDVLAGLDRLDRGESSPFDAEEVKREGRRRLAARRRSA